MEPSKYLLKGKDGINQTLHASEMTHNTSLSWYFQFNKKCPQRLMFKYSKRFNLCCGNDLERGVTILLV